MDIVDTLRLDGSDEHGMTQADAKYRVLWLTVISQAVLEASGKHHAVWDRGDSAEQIQRDAREWLVGDSGDLRLVCFLAGLTREQRVKLVDKYRGMYRPN
jgi:hypothetical protein